MTTPTREQVVQWAEDSGLKIGQHWNRSNMTTAFMLDFATLARADLAATVAEQAKEIEKLKDCWAIEGGQVDQLRQQLAASQAYAAQLREACKDQIDIGDGDVCITLSKALAIQPDETALREHDARLVDIIYKSGMITQYDLDELKDEIKKGEFPPSANQDNPTKPASSSSSAQDTAHGCTPRSLHPWQSEQAVIRYAHAASPAHAAPWKPAP